MRAIAVLFLFLGTACAFAQDPAPAPNRFGHVQLLQWSFHQTPMLTAQAHVQVVELAGQPPPVCAVKLKEMAIPKDVHFTMDTVKPPKIDEKIFVKPPAPPCP